MGLKAQVFRKTTSNIMTGLLEPTNGTLYVMIKE